MHSLLIALHAGTGVAALLAGAVALFRRGRLFDVYLGSLTATTVFLALAVAVEWAVLDVGSRVLFTAFTVLAAVLVARGVLARRLLPGGRSPVYLEHVGFTLVALFDAFVVIAVLNAGAPVWLVVVSGV
ncbi:hypothetical protein [Actinophytocola algeriensis]|uniref:DUF2306 domain-containing protein n=1 Tax=Actinophytocola algeriensis TaxID=1768010 RepID=A0A7W7Q6T1_9PSEU|nr:hypothetical protein [Actinophytocola algeriensis]MBB4907774.1 hypothetical protein [Actinophytocola algeriensis]MBE1479804.1 hypothetical protein [Actinophytocola algeriensis]